MRRELAREPGCSGSRVAGGERAGRRAEAGVYALLIAAVSGVAAQLVVLALSRQPSATLALSEPVATSFSRPDIVDRNGRLLATDLEAPSIYADPGIIIDRDEVVERLGAVLPDLDANELRRALADRSRRFVWVRRSVAPKVAQMVHDLGLPGVEFRNELKRAYPSGDLAGHLLGTVNVDNRGLTGIERYIDDKIGVDPVHAATLSTRTPVRLSIDIGVEHALEDELDKAMHDYETEGAAGLVLNIKTGEVLASASLPRVDPSRPTEALDQRHINRVTAGTYELGSVFKTLTLAMVFDEGIARPTTMVDVTKPLEAGQFTVTDLHAAGRPLSVAEIFTHSSNVGAGMLALETGSDKQERFLRKFGLLDPLRTEEGAGVQPQVPPSWSKAATITVAFGHGLAVTPLQFAAAAATVLNNGKRVQPTFLRRFEANTTDEKPLVSATTSRQIAQLMRLNVVSPEGTGSKADVPGYRVGGKTGTAEMAAKGGYAAKSVISSFLGTFPMDDPQYLTFILLFEPKGVSETGGQRTAGTNAAPVTGRLIARIAGQLGVTAMNASASQ